MFGGEITFAMVPLLTSLGCDDVDGLMMVVVVDWRDEFDAIDDIEDDAAPAGDTFELLLLLILFPAAIKLLTIELNSPTEIPAACNT